jgi:hypothetical protein
MQPAVPRVTHVVLLFAASIVLSACGDESPRIEVSATTSASRATDLSSVCEALADAPRFGGEARFFDAASAGGRVTCGLEFHADAAALSDLGLFVERPCPHEASVIIKFTQTDSGDLVFDESATAYVDNGGCL